MGCRLGPGEEIQDAQQARKLKPWRCVGRGRHSPICNESTSSLNRSMRWRPRASCVRSQAGCGVSRHNRGWGKSSPGSANATCAAYSFSGTKCATKLSARTFTSCGSSTRARIAREALHRSASDALRALDPVPVTELGKAVSRSVTGTGSSALAASQAGMSQASDPGPFPELGKADTRSGNGPGSDACDGPACDALKARSIRCQSRSACLPFQAP